MNALLLPAPGQSSATSRRWQNPEFQKARALDRRDPDGHLSWLRHGPGTTWIDVEDDLSVTTITVNLPTLQQCIRGDERAVEIIAPRTRKGWQAAWRLARQFLYMARHRIVLLRREDLQQVHHVSIPGDFQNAWAWAGAL